MISKIKDFYNKNSNYLIIAVIIFFVIITIVLMKIYRIKSEPFNNKNKTYYFDNNATTFIYDQDIKDEILYWLSCGNPSNILHTEGLKAKEKIDESRQIVADDLKVDTDDIYFTGSATEANNIVIQGIVNGFLKENPTEKCTIITSNIEHPSVLNNFIHYKSNPNIEVLLIPIQTNINDKYYGSINPSDIENVILNAKNKVILISIMFANNETGAIFDIKSIGKLAKKYNIFFHCDATQAIGKYLIYPESLNIQAMSFSGHKFHAPKGIGCLYMKNKCKMLDTDSRQVCAQFSTNTQEKGVRGGTENVSYIVALAYSLRKVHENRTEKNIKMKKMKTYISEQLINAGCKLINPSAGSLDNTLLMILNTGIDICNRNFAIELSDKTGICIGVSSACQTGHDSHVLEAMKIDDKYKDKIIRISLCDYNTYDECKYLVENIIMLIQKHMKI